ncbi:metal-dependent hydrolase family protein [Desulfospira joergensenii]|uniref:metal-dependent hydrolase family protein n=1 Tax=Desulfospira joergensenii TaxID=53329 RepID=UPI0003B6B4F1|nr:amidohydrolase family protein [Desulfospira joergensenii]
MQIVYKNATLISGTGDSPVPNSILVVEDDKILFSGSAENWSQTQDPEESKAVDLKGKWIIPGLIDCHIHMDLFGFGDTFQENLVEDKLRTLRSARLMSDTLRAGFTTVRNVGTVNYIDFAVKEGIEAGYFTGPRIETAGKIISMTCSGTEYFDGMYSIADGVDECRKAAREQLKQGADCLKLMATGAVMNPGGVPGAAQLNEDEIRAVVEEGLKLGKHTAAHAHGAQGIINAVNAGVRTIEHGTMADDQAIEAMAEAGVFLVPTMSLHDVFMENADSVPGFMIEKSQDMQKTYIEIVKKAIKAGIRIAMGTDAGTNYNFHGTNASEIVYLVENKIMTPLEAISAATLVAAEAIGTAHTAGSLEKGKLADFLILDKDPISDIRVLTKNIEQVYKGGQLVS